MWMLSATSKTCGILCEMSTMGMPRALTSRIKSSTLPDSLTPSAAVGLVHDDDFAGEASSARYSDALPLTAKKAIRWLG